MKYENHFRVVTHITPPWREFSYNHMVCCVYSLHKGTIFFVPCIFPDCRHSYLTSLLVLFIRNYDLSQLASQPSVNNVASYLLLTLIWNTLNRWFGFSVTHLFQYLNNIQSGSRNAAVHDDIWRHSCWEKGLSFSTTKWKKKAWWQ